MSLVLYRFSETVADPDLWGHVTFGRVVWQTGAVSQPDPFSYVTTGHRWLNHEWLSEVIFYLAFTAMGPLGLILLKTATSLILFGLLYWHLCRQGLPPLRAGLVVLAVVHFFLVSLITARTLFFSYPLFLVVLIMIWRLSRGRTSWAWTLPALFALWANLHPGFLAGIGILAIWSITELAARWLSPRAGEIPNGPSTRLILTVVTASALATILNPFGLDLWSFLYRTATVPRPDITEWQPLALMTRYGLVYAAYVAVAVWGLLYSRRERPPSLLAVLIVTIVLPLIAIRHTPLSALAIAVLAAEHIHAAWERLLAARSTGQPVDPRRIPVIATMLLLAGAGLFLTLSVPHFSCIQLVPAVGGSYPARVIELIKASGVRGHLAIHFDWGEYAIYHLGPAVKVSVDGRRETAYPHGVYIENQNFMRGLGDWDALLKNHDTHLALVKAGSPAFNLMKLNPGWRLIHEDPLAGLFGRDGLAATETIARTVAPLLPHDGAGSCFP
ncbi:MAG TPA: hypothetical protein VNC82_10755 [Candidatus Limnocylindria bacterium]|nr:hypothetical protein [Candidatus Limnocylindria bacterium]